MATHSSTLAWQIPWMEESGRLQSMGSLGVVAFCNSHTTCYVNDRIQEKMVLFLLFLLCLSETGNPNRESKNLVAVVVGHLDLDLN